MGTVALGAHEISKDRFQCQAGVEVEVDGC